MNQYEPERLLESQEAPAALRSLLVRAQGDVSSLAETQQLVRGAMGRATATSSPLRPRVPARASGPRWTARLAGHSTKVLSAAALVGFGTGALYLAGAGNWHAMRSPDRISTPVPPPAREVNVGRPIEDSSGQGPSAEAEAPSADGPDLNGGLTEPAEPTRALRAVHDAVRRHRRWRRDRAGSISSRPTHMDAPAASEVVASRAPPQVADESPGERVAPSAGGRPAPSRVAPTKPQAAAGTENRADSPAARGQPQFARASGEEASLLRSARQALPKSPARALSLTDEHLRRYPHGVLDQEREALAIEALLKLGRVDEARHRTDVFQMVYPDSPYRERVDRLLTQVGRAASPQ